MSHEWRDAPKPHELTAADLIPRDRQQRTHAAKLLGWDPIDDWADIAAEREARRQASQKAQTNG